MSAARRVPFALLVAALALAPGVALAHQTIPVGDYNLEYGWQQEPPVAGQPNAIVINILEEETFSGVDVSGLRLEAKYGGQTRVLALQPLGEDTPGQYIAPLTPTRAGLYTLHVSGQLEGTAVDQRVTPEEVETADTVEFPRAAAQATQGLGLPGWLSIAGIMLGLLGTALGALALMNRKQG